MRKLLQLKLKLLSRLILKKYQPDIIAISGSVGKTSAKEALALILSSRFVVRATHKNYNNEIGVPLTIIGADSPGSSLYGWFAVFLQAFKLLFFYQANYPKILILEMGIDRPGDMSYLVRLAPPKIAIMTALSHSHMEYFGSLQNIKKEKQVLIEAVGRQGLSVLNYDNEDVRSMATVSKARVLSYGFQEGADLKAQDLKHQFQTTPYEFSGINFKLNYQGSLVPVSMPELLSETGVYAFLAAAAVALHYGMNLMDIAALAPRLQTPSGRMSLLAGIKHTFIIDDTYNASPESTLSAVKLLGSMTLSGQAKKYAILGDMLEIGSYSEEGHRVVGKEISDLNIDYLVSVGERSRDIDRGAKQAGMSADCIYHFDNVEEAGRFVQNRLQEGDLLLIKGSQGMRMEKIVKELMAEPERARELLVRQDSIWQ